MHFFKVWLWHKELILRNLHCFKYRIIVDQYIYIYKNNVATAWPRLRIPNCWFKESLNDFARFYYAEEDDALVSSHFSNATISIF